MGSKPFADTPWVTFSSRRTGWSFGLAALVELFDGDRAGLAGLLEAASSSIARDASEIADAVSSGNGGALVEVAHRLKGTSGTIAAQRIFNVAARLESAATDGSEGLTPLLAELRAAVADVEADIARYLATG